VLILFLLRVYRIVHALSQTVSKILFISMFYIKKYMKNMS
jgi:hypothetical protein